VQTQRAVRDTKRQELDRLEENFRTFIQPHLHGDREDYDLVWGWQKFVFDKNQRIRESE
jgi:cupin superfamily acireductone dioxygenase involved in methionine salvage